jgi:hypothetical protein
MPRGHCGEGDGDPIEDRTAAIDKYGATSVRDGAIASRWRRPSMCWLFNHGTVGSTKAFVCLLLTWEMIMGFGRGLLLWLIGIPLPIILLIALFMHH